ncbi:MAG TPA: ATP-binding protein [Candidatus Binatia bacterium]
MMGRSPLAWQVALPLCALVAAGLAFICWEASSLTIATHAADVRARLASGAALVEDVVGDRLAGANRQALDPVVKQLGKSASLRVTLIAPDGNILGESDDDPAVMDNHSQRPEVVAAIAEGTGTSVRHSDTLSTEMMYWARAVRRDGKLVGVVRTGIALDAVDAANSSLQHRLLLVAATVALAMAAFVFWIIRSLAIPLTTLESLAGNHAGGGQASALPEAPAEIRRVGEAIRRMGAELDSRIASLVAERNEQEAVLSSMVEGVLAIDVRERVMALNAAGARLLEIDMRTAVGRTIHEVARSPDLQRVVAEALRADTVVERDVALRGDQSRFIQAHGAPVRDAGGRRIGAVIVLHDVTQLRRLETVRRDFVANVSHELKTPVTSIKGFLDTLLAGAMNDAGNAKRFLEIASRQADRLGAIIEDLLVLSRIDQESENQMIERSPTSLDSVVRGAVDVCRAKADLKGVHVEVRCDHSVQARINGALVEQALVNLIDNAIKYSDEGSLIEVEAAADDGSALLRVRDHGAGIDAEHLPRLFERFYRVDKARSRSLGGTGLGLAIVKHIVQAQGGSVEVQSRPGSGSMFTLKFPVA